MRKNSLKRIIISLIFIMLVSTTVAYASGSASVTSSLTVGQTGSIKLSAKAPGGFFQGSVSVSDSSIIELNKNEVWADTGDSETANPSQTISFNALKPGTANIVVEFRGENLAGDGFSYNKTFTVTVKEKPVSPKPQTNPKVDQTEKDKQIPKPPQKTPEELEREQLEERMKTPLIREIGIVSASERLKGVLLETIEPESEKFDYSVTLPRNINDIKLEVRSAQENVEFTYDELVTIEEGKDSLEVVIKAKQDKLEQEFKILLKRPEEAGFVIDRDGKQLKLIVDPYLDKGMAALGFEKMFFSNDDESLGFYYALNGQNFVITADGDNNAYTYLLDGELKPAREVFLVSTSANEVSFLVNEVLEAEERLLNENPYEEHEIEISKTLTDLDPSIKFNNKVGGWRFDEDSILTHGLRSDGEVELVHLDNLGNVKAAIVSFDKAPDNSVFKWIYLGFGLWIVTLITFIIYVIVKARKTKKAELAQIYE